MRQGSMSVPPAGEAKIASLGLRIRRGASFHGVALNVDGDMTPFLRINPCGYAGMPMVKLNDLTTLPSNHRVGEQLADALAVRLNRELVSVDGSPLRFN